MLTNQRNRGLATALVESGVCYTVCHWACAENGFRPSKISGYFLIEGSDCMNMKTRAMAGSEKGREASETSEIDSRKSPQTDRVGFPASREEGEISTSPAISIRTLRDINKVRVFSLNLTLRQRRGRNLKQNRPGKPILKRKCQVNLRRSVALIAILGLLRKN